MKKSEIIKLLNNLLETYEDCSSKGAAEDVINLLEKENLIQPTYLGDKNEYGYILNQGWEPEGDKNEEV